MKNRKLILIVSLVLAMTMSLGGTLAYLSDTDADVNTMVLGNVSITQNEHQRAKNADGTYKTDTIDGQTSYVLEVYENDKALLPTTVVDKDGNPVNHGAGDWDSTIVRMTQIGSYGSMQTFTSKNAQDKFVTVTNTGKTDAYVRTLVAIEAGSLAEGLVSSSYHNTWTKNQIGIIKIEENNYMLYEYVYAGAAGVRHENGILPAGDTTYPSLSQVYLPAVANNEDMIALDGNNNGKLDIIVLSQAIQAEGFADATTALDVGFGDVNVKNAELWFADPTVGTPGEKWPNNDVPAQEEKIVMTAAELQTAVDEAAEGTTTILVGGTIEGDVTVTQKAGVKIIIDGCGNEFNGVLTVDGKSATYTTAGLTIKNFNFKADSITGDACIRLGDGNTATRYTCNVTVENCTFDVLGAVGVKSYTGGDKNVTISGCEATAQAHSLCQLKGVDGVLVEGCKVYATRGANFNNSNNVKVDECTFDVQKYALRFGESGNDVVENYTITNNDLTSANEEGDAVIVFRAGAVDAKVTWGGNNIVAANKKFEGDTDVDFVDPQ